MISRVNEVGKNINFKVCILTAGKGSRLTPLTDSINKSVLPVGEKAVISHIIDKFSSDTEFVIAVGYKGETVKQYLKLAHPTGNFSFVNIKNYEGKGSGPGYSILACENYLQCPFIFFSCDTIVTEDIPSCNDDWIGLAHTENPENFCTADKIGDRITKLYDKTNNGTSHAFIGLAGVNNFKVFFDGLRKSSETIDGESQISAGLDALVTHNNLKFKNFTWFDTGTKENLIKSQNFFKSDDFDFSKSDEYIYFQSNRVIKFFANSDIAQKRYSRSLDLEDFVPPILECKHGFYAYEFTEGKVLYDCDLASICHPLFIWLHEKFWKDVELSDKKKLAFKDKCKKFYLRKTQDRIELFNNGKNNINFFSCSVNGQETDEVERLLDSVNWDYISDGVPSRFHGDLQFDNILHLENGNFKLIDWRQDFSGIVSYGDRYYDYAKLLGGMIVSYREIKRGNFCYSFDGRMIEFKLPQSEELNIVKTEYYKSLKAKGIDISKVCLITALIFLNMAPLHTYPFNNLLYSLGRLSLNNALRGEAL